MDLFTTCKTPWSFIGWRRSSAFWTMPGTWLGWRHFRLAAQGFGGLKRPTYQETNRVWVIICPFFFLCNTCFVFGGGVLVSLFLFHLWKSIYCSRLTLRNFHKIEKHLLARSSIIHHATKKSKQGLLQSSTIPLLHYYYWFLVPNGWVAKRKQSSHVVEVDWAGAKS